MIENEKDLLQESNHDKLDQVESGEPGYESQYASSDEHFQRYHKDLDEKKRELQIADKEKYFAELLPLKMESLNEAMKDLGDVVISSTKSKFGPSEQAYLAEKRDLIRELTSALTDILKDQPKAKYLRLWKGAMGDQIDVWWGKRDVTEASEKLRDVLLSATITNEVRARIFDQAIEVIKSFTERAKQLKLEQQQVTDIKKSDTFTSRIKRFFKK